MLKDREDMKSSLKEIFEGLNKIIKNIRFWKQKLQSIDKRKIFREIDYL